MAIPLADFKQHLNITSSTNDDELQSILDAAEAWVEKHTGLQLGAGTRTFTVYASARSLLLPTTNVVSVTSVTDPDGLTVTVLSRDMNLHAGIVTVPYYKSGPWTVVATFDAAVPADLAAATLMIASHLWDTQRGTSPTGLQQPDEVTSFGGGVSYAIPNRALEMLEAYLLPGIA